MARLTAHPAYVARCTGVADVIAACASHASASCWSQSAPVVTASPGMRSATGARDRPFADEGHQVDPRARTAQAQAGVLWGELDRETQLHGLATVGGIDPTPGSPA